jgi:hypothetical protein
LGVDDEVSGQPDTCESGGDFWSMDAPIRVNQSGEMYLGLNLIAIFREWHEGQRW